MMRNIFLILSVVGWAWTAAVFTFLAIRLRSKTEQTGGPASSNPEPLNPE